MKTKRLLLRRFAAEDWQDLHEYLSREEVVRFEPYEVFTKEASREEALRRSLDDRFWAVCLLDSGKVIGNIYLAEQGFDTWELGYVFNPDYQGQGYATEAARGMIDDLFARRAGRRVVAMCNPCNTASWKLLERLGMRREGHLLQNVYFKKDQLGRPIWLDTFEYAILADEWPPKA